jgi:hypothetical protein
MKLVQVAVGFLCTLICLIALAMMALYFAISSQWRPNRNYPPPSAINAPIYPGATHVTSDTTSIVNVKSYEFQTHDKPADVLNYYKCVLIDDGWEERNMQSGWESHAASYMLHDPDGPGFYSLELDAPIRSTDNITHVTIRLVGEPGGW